MNDYPPPNAGPLLLESPNDSPAAREDGPDLPEYLYRAGLLAGALVFFHESLGLPWSRNLFGVLGILVALVMTLTLVFRWRVMGDWRRGGNKGLYILLAMVLSFPVSAALDPSVGASLLPDAMDTAMAGMLSAAGALPGASMLLAMIKGAISFFMLVITLGPLVLGSGGGRRVGLLVASTLLSAVCLFFHPTIETMMGFVFLGVFLSSQWEVPLMLPDRIRRALNACQIDYLRELTRETALSTGETRLYLENNPRLFTELLEFQLVEYDPIARVVVPGRRLAGSGAAESVERSFSILRRIAWFAIGIVYFLLPDLIPGPFDDALIMLICTMSGFDLFSLLRGTGRGRMGR